MCFPFGVMDDWQKKYEKTKYEMFGYFYMLCASNLALVLYLYNETLNPTEKPNAPSLEGEPAPIDIILVRFIAAIFLHFLFLTEYEQGFQIMKYSLNHSWKFESW